MHSVAPVRAFHAPASTAVTVQIRVRSRVRPATALVVVGDVVAAVAVAEGGERRDRPANFKFNRFYPKPHPSKYGSMCFNTCHLSVRIEQTTPGPAVPDRKDNGEKSSNRRRR